MADFDRRPRRGGGQFNNRKRRYRDDEFDDRRPQRRRYEDPPAVVLRKQVLHLAESPHRKAEDEVAAVAKQIAENYFDTDLTNAFLDLSVQLTLEQPLKIPFLAAIVLVTNAQKPEFTEEVLKKLAEALQKHIDQGCWREVKLLLRFLACLQGLFMGDGIFPFLEELFSRAADLQTESSEDALGLELTKIILFSIAYAMASSATGYEPLADALLEKTDIIASTSHPLENLVDPFPSPDATLSHESLLSLMQKRMTEESKAAWRLSCLPRPWKISRSDEEEDPLATAQKYPFPTVNLPQTLPIGPRQLFPEVYLSVYLDQELDSVPPSSNTSALLIRDSLVDSINVMHFNRAVAGKSLIDLDCYFAPDTFVKRATPFDKIGEVAGEGNSWKPEDVVVDATFAQLLSLPTPEHKPVYYHSVLTESCKIAPAAVAPSLGRAIRYLYRNVDRMDIELVQRFLDWFSHHLSNFGFTWKWTEWIEDLELPDVDPKKAFIRDALDKEIRLSFAQRIKGTLPEPYQTLIPPEKEKDSPDFKYNDPSTPFADLALELSAKIKSRAGDDEIDSLLSQIEEQATSSGLSKPKVAVVDVYTTCIVNIGSKSLSHVLAIIERNRERLLAMANEADGEGRKQIIASVLEYWRWQIGTGIVIIDKLLNYGIITPGSVIEWALVDHIERGTVLSQNWYYELISRTLSKVIGRVRQVVDKIRNSRLGDEERATLQEVLNKEVASMKSLFGAIEDAVSPVAAASQDGMIESSDRLREEEETLLRSWGAKWVRWVRRRGAVEESWVKEELAKPLPPVPEPEPEKMEEVKEGNGLTETNGEMNGERGGERNGGEEDVVE